MARIRSIKPGYCTSEAIAELSLGCELHFVKLWMYCDDYGRALDNPRLIKAAVWPLRDEVTAEQVAEWQDELEKHNRIVRYTVKGKALFEVCNWSEHQKPQHPKDSEWPSADSPEVDVKPHEVLMKVTEDEVTVDGDVDVDGVGDGGILPDADSTFSDFWHHYPRHHTNGKPGGGASRAKTFALWKKLSPAQRDDCNVAVIHYEMDCASSNGPYPCHATTWLNEQRWLDWLEPADYSQARAPAGPKDRFAEMAMRFHQREEAPNGHTNGIADSPSRSLPQRLSP